MHAVSSFLLQSSLKLSAPSYFFDEPGTKINAVYYHDVLLQQKLQPAIRRVSGNDFVFHQDSARAHRSRATVELLLHEMPAFFRPTCDVRTAQLLLLWITRCGLSRSAMSTRV